MRKLFVTAVATAAMGLATVAIPVSAGATAKTAIFDGEVTGQILNTAGKPIPGACFTMWTSDGIFATQAQANGDYDAINLPEGAWEATAGVCSGTDDYAPTVWNDSADNKGYPGLDAAEDVPVNVLGAGVPTTEINFVLQKGGSLKVKVVNAITGHAVKGLEVCPDASTPDSFDNYYQTGFCGTTNGAGTVDFHDLVAGPTIVWASGTKYPFSYYPNGTGGNAAQATAISVVAGKTASLNFPLSAS